MIQSNPVMIFIDKNTASKCHIGCNLTVHIDKFEIECPF